MKKFLNYFTFSKLVEQQKINPKSAKELTKAYFLTLKHILNKTITYLTILIIFIHKKILYLIRLGKK